MEGHLNKEFTLSELEPGWTEEPSDSRKKTSMRMQGSLRMSLLRVGKNPENSRKYVFGDPVSMIDWKAFARTDNLIVREQRDEASARVVVVFDCGPTMRWPVAGNTQNAISKAELAIRIGLWLAHTHLVLGDSVECWWRGDMDLPDRRWRPRSPADVITVFEVLSKDVVTLGPQFFTPTPWMDQKCDTLWLLTDGLDGWNTDVLLESSRLPRLIHTVSSLEHDLSWMEDDTCYLERIPVRKDFMGRQLKTGTAYQDRFKSWCDSWRHTLRRAGGDYFLATDKTPVGLLVHFLHAGGVES